MANPKTRDFAQAHVGMEQMPIPDTLSPNMRLLKEEIQAPICG